MTETSQLLELEYGKKAIDPAKYSVQSRSDDSQFAPTSDVAAGGGVFWVTLGTSLDEEPKWNPIYPNWRDRYLLQFTRTESMLASAIYSMKTRVGTLNYALNGPPRAKKFAQDLLNNPGLGDNLSTLVQKVSGDLDSSDNGAFIELWRAGNPMSDAKDRPVLGFAHLDSRQCWRSFDPEFPVWYTNPITGAIRKLHRSRVIFTADNPQSVELARGIGFCATSRALRMTRVFRNMQIFLDEKVSGRFTRAIGAVNGITAHQLRRALTQSEEEADSKGYLVYRDIPFVINPSGEPGSDIKIVLQDLASIPDGFVFRDDADLYAYILAFCFGVDAREFWPATQSGATKADATVQNMKARGRGIGNRIQTLESLLRKCIPETVEFEYDFTDDEQDQMQAEINKTRVTYLDMLVKNGTINTQQSLAVVMAEGIIDARLLESLPQQPVTSDTNPDTPQPEPDANTQDSAQPQDANATGQMALNRVGEFTTFVREASPTRFKSSSSYRSALRANVKSLWTGSWSVIDFYNATANTVTQGFDQAWEEGAAKVGIKADERTDEETARLALEINLEVSHILKFGTDIANNNKENGGSLDMFYNRVDLWVNSYERILNLAEVMAASDKKLKWKQGPTEQGCIDCTLMDGRVYRGSIWQKYGWEVRSKVLSCGGWKCQCEFVVTDEPVTKGIPPKPTGALAKSIDSTAALTHVHEVALAGVPAHV